MMEAAKLSALFDAHGAQLVLYARQWLDASAAQDVVQEVYVRLMLQAIAPGNARAWLFKAVRNEAISQMRSFTRRRRREEASVRQEWFEPLADDAIDADAACEAMQSLPEAQREAIVLRIWGQLTLKEIAAVTGTSISGVFEQYRAGLAALRQRMGVTCESQNG